MGQDGIDLSTTTNLAPNTSDTSTGFHQSYNNYYGLYYIDHSNPSSLNTTSPSMGIIFSLLLNINQITHMILFMEYI